MRRRETVGLLISAAARLAAATPPETPAGKALAAWLAAFNSGDKAQLVAFAERYQPDRVTEAERLVGFRKMTGGFDLLRIEKSDPALIAALLKERNSDNVARIELGVTESEPVRVTRTEIRLVPAPAGVGPARMSDEEASAALEKYLAERSARDEFSGAVLVSRNGKLLVDKVYGLADRERKLAVTPDTQFRIGSMNKMFTAVATLRLVQSGKVQLDDSLGTHLKEYPNADVATKVKVRHLLSHTGGTGDIFGPEFEKQRLELKALEDYVRLYGARPLAFEPGSRWAYSNYGFLLLGVLIQRVSGKDYYDFVRQEVFAPAGMKSTDSLPEESSVERRSTGYMRRQDTWTPNTGTLPWRGTSAGGGYSTVQDLHRFAVALLAGKLLSPELLKQATTPQAEKYGFGFGTMSGEGGAPRGWGHGGGAPGMNGDLRVYPDSGSIVVLLANLDPPAASRPADFYTLRMPA